MASDRPLPQVPGRPECSDGASAKNAGAFNAHSFDGRSGDLAQHVFPSPARNQTAEPPTVRSERRAAERKTLYVMLQGNRVKEYVTNR